MVPFATIVAPRPLGLGTRRRSRADPEVRDSARVLHPFFLASAPKTSGSARCAHDGWGAAPHPPLGRGKRDAAGHNSL